MDKQENKYIYIELLRQVCPDEKPFIDFNFFLLGSFDAMSVDTGDSINALKKKYEENYSTVLSVFDRQPVYMYSKDPVDLHDPGNIFNTSSQDTASVPLVLTLFQLDKLSLAKRKFDDPIVLIEEFSEMLAKKINPEHVNFQVFWNLGESDIVTVFRTEYLNEISVVLHNLRINILSDETMNIISTSSHCAFPLPIGIDKETSKNPTLCRQLINNSLEKWLMPKSECQAYHYSNTDFLTLGNVASCDKPTFKNREYFSFLFGEWDYMMRFDSIPALIDHLCDTFLCLVTKNKELSSYAPFRVSYTIPMFRLPNPIDASSKPAAKPFDAQNSDGEPQADPIQFLDDLSKEMNNLHNCIDDHFPKERKKGLCREIKSFKNSLTGLGKFLYRLRIGRFEEDLYAYIQPVFIRLTQITRNYTGNIKDYITAGDPTEADHLVIEYLEDTSMLIENLQHLFSIMAVSPHTYMETYGSNMRSLAAADKLLNAYQGIIQFLKDKFPDQFIQGGKTVVSTREILIFPYRKTQSSHTLLYRHSHPSNRISYISLDFSKMFDPTGTIFMLLHECGHHLGNRLREERFRLFYAALICDVFCWAGVNLFIQEPIEYLIQIIGQKDAYAGSDAGIANLLFQGLSADNKKILREDYVSKIRKDIGDYTYSIGCSCAEDPNLFEKYAKHTKNPPIPDTIDLINNYYSGQILEYLEEEGIPDYFGINRQERGPGYAEHVRNKLRDKVAASIAYPLKGITTQLAADIAKYHGNTREALRIKTMYGDTGQIISDFIDPLETIIADKWKDGSCYELLSVFSNVYSDLFAISILDLAQQEYLDIIKKLLGTERTGLIAPNNLLRFYAVCDSKWHNTDVSLFSDIFKIDMTADGERIWNLIQYNPYYPFILEYAEACLRNLNADVDRHYDDDKKAFDMLRAMIKDDADKIDSIYYFYQYLMGKGV